MGYVNRLVTLPVSVAVLFGLIGTLAFVTIGAVAAGIGVAISLGHLS